VPLKSLISSVLNTLHRFLYKFFLTHVAHTQAGPILAMQHFADDSDRKSQGTRHQSFGCREMPHRPAGQRRLWHSPSSPGTSLSAMTSEALYSSELTGFQTASSFLRTIRPLQPEMAFTLCTTKVSWATSRTKRLGGPTPDNIDGNHDHVRYIRRPPTQMGLSFVEWLHVNNTTGIRPKKYTTGTTLVGVG